jgi:hypothetical protein
MATTMTALEAALASPGQGFARRAPVAKSTPEQMAFARAEAARVVTHDGLRPGERMVAGRVYVFNANSLGRYLAETAAQAPRCAA